jgi:hypothetical protein
LAAKGQLTTLEYGEHVLFSPFGIEYTLEAARAIIEGEQLGRDEFPDMLCINFSTNDYIGHAFGPHSLEVEDITYQTDRQLGEFLRYLDQYVGAGNWTLRWRRITVSPRSRVRPTVPSPAERNPLGSQSKSKAA